PFIGALKAGAVAVDESGAHLRGFPATFDELETCRVVVLANVPAGAFTIEQRALLEDFVMAGGGLIVLGGPYAFGGGGYHASDIFTRLLPVTPAGAHDMLKHPAPQPLQAAGPATLAADLLRTRPPVVLYQHKLIPKKGAVVQVMAGGQPLIVTGAYGKGRVAAVLATPLGPDAPNAWWTSPLWPQIMVRLLAWGAGQ
ncbi:MAG TPA: glutamine amidotransferase, partial [Armatimonadota bacterium]|nr:glutamine amidotransferase [Armatimonadota bacterium]